MKFRRWFLMMSVSLFCASIFAPLSAEAKFALFKKTTPTTTSAVQVNPSVADKVTNKSGDTTLPEIKFLFPLNGETAHRNGTGIINASVEATDNVGVDRVEINAGAGGSIVKMTKRVYYPYAAELNTTAEQIGQTISLVATAYDKAGNQRSASISFTLEKYNNPAEYYGLIATLNKVVIDSALKALGGSLPSFKFLEPTASQIVSGTVHVRGELLADPTHVDKVEVSIDSETPKDLHAPFEFDWDTTKVTNGNHSISAQIFLYDASSLPKIEHPVGVNNPPPPDTTSPEIEITSPASEDTVKGTIQINVNATDEGGIAKVEITPGEDNPPVTLTSAPYTASWDTTTVPDGRYKIQANATDKSGNVKSEKIFLVVHNQVESSSIPEDAPPAIP